MHLAIISGCTARLYQKTENRFSRGSIHDFPTVRNTGLNAYNEGSVSGSGTGPRDTSYNDTPECRKHADK